MTRPPPISPLFPHTPLSQSIAGVIYNPANDELYIAERGKGAFLNDQRLRVAGRRRLDECVVACGLPHIGRGDHQLALNERSEEHTSELQSPCNLVCRLLLEK